jgi:hypothetical protein
VALPSLSITEARSIGLTAQGLSGVPPRTPAQLLDLVGAVQLDTISVLARSHLLVAWSRLGALPRESIEAAYWPGVEPTTFEYWAHAACIIPLRRWPEFAFRRRAALARGRRWHRLEHPESSLQAIRTQLRDEGPLTANQLGGAKKSGPWWDWTEAKIAVEFLLDIGEVVCVERRGWRRVYDLSERAIPSELRAIDLDDAACRKLLLLEAARALGVGTLGDLARHQKMTLSEIRPLLGDTELVEVQVEGSSLPWYATPSALESLHQTRRTRATLLSPFDSLLWERPRVQRLFGVEHRLEAYVPKAQRVHGYYAMPVLSGTELVATVDPARERDTLVIRHISLRNKAAIVASAVALLRARDWVGATQVRIERVSPPEFGPALQAAVHTRNPGHA